MINTSFETVGASPGLADGWTSTSQSSAEEIGEYDGLPVELFFPGWSNADYSAVILTQSVGIVETFELGWSNNGYVDFIAGAAAGNDEDFSSGWSNDDYSDVTDTSAAGGTEAFDAGWSNDTYAATTATAETGLYYSGSQAFEGFEPVVTDATFEASGALLASLGHSLVNGNVVTLVTTGTLPAGLTGQTKYFVVQVVAAVSFKLSATLGGSAITTTSAGTGIHNTHGDETLYWTTVLG